MENNKTKLIPFDTLKMQLIDQLKERRFAESTIHCIEIEARHLQDYLSAHRLYGYNPEIGNAFLEEFFEDGRYSEKSLVNYNALIRRLDDMYYERDFIWRHSSKQSVAPEWCLYTLSKHLENCKVIGNAEKSTIRKEVACRKFFIRLADAGCNCMEDISAEKIQAATLAETAESNHCFVREMLSFFAASGMLAADYSTLIPKIRRSIKLPTTYSRDEIERAENAVNTETDIGKRDKAIILLSTRLGIRAGDIAGLRFENIKFNEGKLHFVQEKTKNPIELVLLPEVRDALMDYVENARPQSDSDYVFLSVRTPHRVIDRTLVHHITTQNLDRAEVDYSGKKHGPHSFRSSLATAMINNGMPYDAVRKVLGHKDPESIKHYAALDIESLRRCAIEVPKKKGVFADLLSGKERG